MTGPARHDHAVGTGPIVVLGAGILGVSAAWHLTRLGAPQVVVVEAGPSPACGTSGAGAGFVGLWAAGVSPAWGEAELALEKYALRFYRDLHARADIGLGEVGNLFVAFEPASKVWLDDILSSADAPEDAQRVDAEQVETLCGLDSVSVQGAVLHRSGVQIDPPKAVITLAEEAQAAGVEFRFDATAQLKMPDGGRAELLVDGEPLRASKVIVAAGAWTADLLAPLGVTVPQVPHLVPRTLDRAAAPAHSPTLQWRDLGGGGWARNYRGQWCYGFADSYRPVAAGEIPSPGQRPMADGAQAAAWERELAMVLPALRGSARAAVDVGLPCFTADRRHLAGPVPGHPDLLVLTGDNEVGISHGPGLGRHIAELAMGREPTVHAGYELDRPQLLRGEA